MVLADHFSIKHLARLEEQQHPVHVCVWDSGQLKHPDYIGHVGLKFGESAEDYIALWPKDAWDREAGSWIADTTPFPAMKRGREVFAGMPTDRGRQRDFSKWISRKK